MNKNKQPTGVQKAVSAKELIQQVEQGKLEDEALAMPLWLKWAFVVVILLAVIMGLWVGLV